MDLVTTKLLVGVLFFLIRLGFGILPIKIYCWIQTWEEGGTRILNEKRHAKVQCYITLFQAFGGGVLFATCFLHMMLQVYLSVRELDKFGYLNQHYPYSQLIVSLGFFFVYLVEEASHWAVSKVPDKKRRNPYLRTPKITPNVDEKRPPTATTEITYIDLDTKNSLVDIDEKIQEENERNLEKTPVEAEAETEPDATSEDIEESQVPAQTKTRQELIRCILIIIALSFHSIFEGLSIGLQKSTANIWYLFVSGCIHAGTLLFGIGLEMAMRTCRYKAIIGYMTLFASTSTIGVYVGLAIFVFSDIETSAKAIAILVLEGLSAGTILYIVFFEVLHREKQRRTWRLSRCICILSGFTLMAVMESGRI